MHSFRDDIPVPFTVSATRSSKISELLVLKELIDMPLGSLCKLIIARARTHKTHTELLPCSIYGSNHENASLVKFFFSVIQNRIQKCGGQERVSLILCKSVTNSKRVLCVNVSLSTTHFGFMFYFAVFSCRQGASLCNGQVPKQLHRVDKV